MPKKPFCERIPSFFVLLAGVLFVLILCLLIVFDGSLSFAFQNRALASNGVLAVLALGLILFCLLVNRRFFHKWTARASKIRPQKWLLLLGAAHGLLFIAQWILLRSLWFYPGWDVLPVRQAAEDIARGLPISNSDYFWMIPHNAPLTLLLSVPYWIGLQLGLAEPYIMLPISGALFINLSCFFTTLSLFRMTRSLRATGFGFALSTVWILLSPYVSVPYSDAFSILFPALALCLSLSGLRPIPKWFWVTAVSFLGASIKPHVMIFWIALVLLECARQLSRLAHWRKNGKRLALFAAALLLALLPGLALQNTAKPLLAGDPNPEGQLPPSHYLMMGFNLQTYGGNAPEDEAFSLSFPTLAERKQANYQEIGRRLTSMSLPKAIEFFSAKLYKAYNSGTFAWNGSFLQLEVPRRTDALSALLRSLYYTNGASNGLFVSACQVLWLAVLLLCAFAFTFGRKKQPHLPPLALTLLGLSAYLLLFECWPRYLFLYAPFFVVCATLGLQSLARAIPSGK